jgi:hypothetical protein
MIVRISALGLTALLCACASVAQQDSPAVRTAADAASHAELVSTISSALAVKSVTIADDALTRESLLIIERGPARDAAGQRLSGRDLDKPEHFQLLRKGDRCLLLHVRTGKRYELTRVSCRPMQSG